MFRVFNEKVYFEDEMVRLFPVLEKLTDQQKEMIVLAEYYGSPYARFPEHERWQKAKRKVYGRDDVPTEELAEAIKIVKSANFDSKRETVRVFTDKIQSLQDKLISEDDSREITQLDLAIERLQKRIDKLQNEIESGEQLQMSLKGNKKLSFIENWQENMRKASKNDSEKILRAGTATIE